MTKQLISRRKALIMGKLRELARYMPEKQTALRMAEIPNMSGPRGGRRFRCNHCGKAFVVKDVQVDHIDPVIPHGMTLNDLTYDTIVERLFCDPKNLQVLCKPCHQIKTNEERKLKKEARNK